MNPISYKESYAWGESIELISKINRLSEDLPELEQATLAAEMRRTAIDIAAAIAVDILSSAPARMDFVCRLDAELELIKRVYSALDTAPVDVGLGLLIKRLQSDAFADAPAKPAPEVDQPNEAEDDDEPSEPSDDSDETA